MDAPRRCRGHCRCGSARLAACGDRLDRDDSCEVVTVSPRTFTATVVALGAVKPQIGAEVRFGSRISGRVGRLSANIGDRVDKGQIIAELEHQSRSHPTQGTPDRPVGGIFECCAAASTFCLVGLSILIDGMTKTGSVQRAPSKRPDAPFTRRQPAPAPCRQGVCAGAGADHRARAAAACSRGPRTRTVAVPWPRSPDDPDAPALAWRAQRQRLAHPLCPLPHPSPRRDGEGPLQAALPPAAQPFPPR